MTTVLQIGDRTISDTEIMPLLSGYQLLPQLIREMIIDAAIADIPVKRDPTTLDQFFQSLGIETVAARQAWQQRYETSEENLWAIATRAHRLHQFKETTFGLKAESHFLRRKPQMDRVVYSLIRVQDAALCQELYFRMQAGEQSFAEVAREYSEGPEAETYGVVGPVELGNLLPQMVQLLRSAVPGQLQRPLRLQHWFVILRLERIIPTQFNALTRQIMIDELFEQWLQPQLHPLNGCRAKQ